MSDAGTRTGANSHEKYARLIAAAQKEATIKVAVAHPCDDVSLRGAAAIKKIVSPVAGRANVLVVPDLEAGNMLAKSLSFLSQAEAAGIVLGALGADFRRAAASITATAQEARRVTRESARLVKMIGTRAPSTMPAASA